MFERSYTIQLSSWKINVFNNVIILLAMFSIIYLLLRLRSRTSEVLPLYFTFIVVATVSFVFVVIVNLVGDANAEDVIAKKIIKVRSTGFGKRKLVLSTDYSPPVFFLGNTTYRSGVSMVYSNRTRDIYVSI